MKFGRNRPKVWKPALDFERYVTGDQGRINVSAIEGGSNMLLDRRIVFPKPARPLGSRWESKSIHLLHDPAGNDDVGCHDDQTEVLTEDGWVAWPDYRSGALATFNTITGALEYQTPLSLTRYHHKGPMHFGVAQGLDFALTPEHRIFHDRYVVPKPYSPGAGHWSGAWGFSRIDALPSRVAIPAAPSGFVGTNVRQIKIGDRLWDGDDLARLAALVISDGFATHESHRVSFCCFRPDREDMIRAFCQRLEIAEQPSRPGVWYMFGDHALIQWFIDNAYASDKPHRSPFKRVPQIIKCMSQPQIEAFLDFYGDVSKGGDRFYTSSRQLADDLQELTLKTGVRASISERDPRPPATMKDGKIICSDNPAFTISRRSVDTTLAITNAGRQRSVEVADYDGEVFCATVPNSTLITRRNKDVLISGNCCTCAGVVKLDVEWQHNAAEHPINPDMKAAALGLYSRVTGYNPADPSTDQGAELTQVLDYVKANGIYPDGSGKIAGYVAVDATKPDQVAKAIDIMGGVYSGAEVFEPWCTDAKEGGVWDVLPGNPTVAGGHCVSLFDYNEQGVILNSWGMFITLTWAALAKYWGKSAGGEVYAVFSPDWLIAATETSPSGFNAAQLAADIAAGF